MIDGVIVVGLTMSITQIVKWYLKKVMQEDFVGKIIPIEVLLLAGVLNVVNAAVFAQDPDLIGALAEGIRLGAMAGGIYSMGKKYLEKPEGTIGGKAA